MTGSRSWCRRALVFLLAMAGPTAWAQTFPSKPVKIIIGFPAGGPLDAHARLMTDRLQQLLGQPVIVDYKAGAGGTVGADLVAKSPPDGYTLLLANTGTMVINEALYSKPLYRTLKDFAPVTRTAQQPLALLVHPGVAATNVRELVDLLKKNPAATTTARPATAASATWCPRCSRTPPAPSWSTFPIAAARRPSPT